MNLSPEEHALLHAGEEASSLLSNPTFVTKMNTLSTNITQSLLSTALGDTQKREELYYLHTAVSHLVGLLQADVQNAQTIKDRMAVEAEAGPENE